MGFDNPPPHTKVCAGAFPPFFQYDATEEAKAAPRKIFEWQWVKWLPGTTHAPCEKGLQRVVKFVLQHRMLHPDPRARPQTAQESRALLEGALATYQAGL